jgi:predicted RNA-binding Zn ribbon-like protein
LERAELTLRSVQPRAERQVGDRRQAPGELGLVQAFVNSSWALDNDNQERFVSPEALAGWLHERELIEPGTRVGEDDLRRALDVRAGLRALLFANNGSEADREAVARLNDVLRVPGPFVRLDPSERPDFGLRRGGLDPVLALIATIVAVAQLDGHWPRLKACPGEDCGWAFYDHSRNQGGNWCSMSVCGARAKAREYRRRKRRDA